MALSSRAAAPASPSLSTAPQLLYDLAMATRRSLKAAGLAGMAAAALTATPAHACLIIVGGPPPPGSLIVVESYLAADERPSPASDMAAWIKRLLESAVPGEMPILRLPRVPPGSPCSRHFGYVPGPSALELVRRETASGPPGYNSGVLVEFVSPPRESEFRFTLGGRPPEE